METAKTEANWIWSIWQISLMVC